MLTDKKETYQIDQDTANAALQNILAACDKEPNTIPLEKLSRRYEKNTLLCSVMLVLTGILFLLTLLLPLYLPTLLTFARPYFAPAPVALVNDHVEEGILYLEFTGDHILYEQAYMKTNDGRTEKVFSYDAQAGIIAFPYYADVESNIYIPVMDGEVLQFLVTPDP